MKAKVNKNLKKNIFDIYEGFVRIVDDMEENKRQKIRLDAKNSQQKVPFKKCIITDK
jgi:hypothetical protein